MRIFHCDHCSQPIFFENTFCGKCGHKLAYLPDLKLVASLHAVASKPGQAEAAQHWTTPIPRAKGRQYRLCENYAKHHVCNWAVPADDLNPLCQSCRLTRMIPDLTQPGNLDAWRRLETAKRRVIYSLV